MKKYLIINVRCYFAIEMDCYVFLDIEKHKD